MSEGEEQNITAQEKAQQQIDHVSSTSQKTNNSYTYWVKDNNKSRELPPEQRPQKIDPPKVITQKADDGRSDWNKAGTWEHRTISLPEVEKQYTQKVNEWLSTNLPQAKLKTLSLKGQCQIVFIRTKKALTYEINGTVEFQKILPQEKVQEKQEKLEPLTQKSSSDDLSAQEEKPEQKNTSKPEEKTKEKSKEKQKKKSKSSKSKPKPKTMTFEIVDLTDHGDRQFKSKADDVQDKKFIAQNSQKLLVLLENILKSYK